jgi:hypothetical protein
VPHEATALAEELASQADGDTELIIVFGASAIADRRDVIPSAIGCCHIWTLPAGKDFVERECKWSGAVISTACKCGSCGRGP